MLRISTEEENYQDFKTPPRSPSNKSNLSLDDARNQDSLSRTHSLKSPSKRKNDLRSSAIIRYAFILPKLELLRMTLLLFGINVGLHLLIFEQNPGAIFFKGLYS